MQTLQEVSSKIVYQIDSRDRLIAVDDAWRQFAEENQASDLAGDGILGRSLWDLITDNETRHLFSPILTKVREKGKSLTLHLRCDAPDTRRYLRLTLEPLPEQGVEFTSETIRTEKRTRVPLLDTNGVKTRDFLNICGWCKRVAVPGGWTEVEFAVALFGLFDESPLPQLSHDICPDCRADIESEIQDALSGPSV